MGIRLTSPPGTAVANEHEAEPDLEPSWLGLPKRFTAYRPGQARIIVDVSSSNYRFSGLDAPTGFGKSATYASMIRLSGAKRALILVGTKGLMSQLVNEFHSMGLREIKGQSNYQCRAVQPGGELFGVADVTTTCKEGPCKVGLACSLRKAGCHYYDAQRVAADAEIVVSNYSYWLSMARFGDPMAIGKFDLLILDEAHSSPEWLADHCVVELDRKEVRATLNLDLPPIDEGVAVWATWAKDAAALAHRQLLDAKSELDDDLDTLSFRERKEKVKRMHKLQRLVTELGELAKAHSWRSSEGAAHDVRMPGMEVDWIAQQIPTGMRFSPVWAHPYAEEYLFRGIPKVVLCSATLSKQITRYLGIAPGTWDWHEVREGFRATRRPIIYVPTTRVDMRMDEVGREILIDRVDEIIGPRIEMGRKGLIPSVSYALAKLISERSRYRELMVTHKSGEVKQAIERYRKSTSPLVLVSPSIVEGFDFPGDLCRFIIVPKLPFADGRDPVEKARRKSDPDWSTYTTTIAVVQTCGRGMRSSDDWCEIFIVDNHFSWFRGKASFAGWYRDALRQESRVPPPLNLLTTKKH